MTPTTSSHRPFLSHLFEDRRFSVVWLIVRLYVGYKWISAGISKVTNSAWVGSHSGTALGGFVSHSLSSATLSVSQSPLWYQGFLQHFVAPHLGVWSVIVAFGELLVGIGLILGLFTGVAAFFGIVMNLNYILAGTISSNPILLVLGFLILYASPVAGNWGLDHFRPRFRSRLRS